MFAANSYKVENFSVEQQANIHKRYQQMLNEPMDLLFADEGWNVRCYGISLSQLQGFMAIPPYDVTEQEVEFAKRAVARLQAIQADFPNRNFEGKEAECFKETKELVARLITYFTI